MPKLEAFNNHRLSKDGRYGQWMDALCSIKTIEPGWHIEHGVVHAGLPLEPDQKTQLEKTLHQWIPWRKGPWCLGGVSIDSEWRCDWKWARVCMAVDLENKHILDVGAGNGYFGWQMLDAGAKAITACDPTALFVMQHTLVSRFAGDARNQLWGCRLEDLPHDLGPMDVAFSMGVLSHRRYLEGHHMAHLGLLYRKLIPNGELVLETLVVPEAAAELTNRGDLVLIPKDRYARMRNVYALPTKETLLRWLAMAGFDELEFIGQETTATEEQRATDWAPYQSLADGLSEQDPNLTIEGYPRPTRAIVVGKKSA